MRDDALPKGDRDERPSPRRPGETVGQYTRRLAIEDHGLKPEPEDMAKRTYYPPTREPGQEG